MDPKLINALTKLFDKHRIVFWYDANHELRAEFESLQLDDVEKIELKDNEFGVKYRILREQPTQKFLLYQDGPQPDNSHNWLLDVLLAHGEFRSDQVSMWLGQLELGPEYREVVEDHKDFFRSNKRLEALKAQVDSKDSFDAIRLKMLSVCVKCEPRLDEVLEGLLAELANEKEDHVVKLIEASNLTDFLWKRVQQDYGYRSSTPGVKDFAITLFKSCYAMGLGLASQLTTSSLAFFKRWKTNSQSHNAFEALSGRFADLLKIESDLDDRDYRVLVDIDMYRLIDLRIIAGLVKDVADRTIPAQECADIVFRRQNGFWHNQFEDLYLALSYAAHFLEKLATLDLTVQSLTDGVKRYSGLWYVVDQFYRKFTYHALTSSQHTLLQHLSERIENMYSNSFLPVLNENWQAHVDKAATWAVPGIPSQREFFSSRVQPYLDRGNKIFVIISDALRYEIAEEFVRLIRAEDRYEAEIEPAVSVLPSYTQLGMAALLPQTSLLIDAEQGIGVVYLEGKQDTRGTVNRAKVLANAARGTALQAKDFLLMPRHDARELARNYDVIYVYHNRIDEVGDDLGTEGGVFEAAEDALKELVKLVRKLQSDANANNFLLTADHGFIYQNKQLAESDFLSVEPRGERIVSTDRRFVVGQGLQQQTSFKTFTAAQAGLESNLELQFPKSINRLRKQGSGSRYVHGGTSLQEVVIPVVSINKKRSSDVRRVEVDIVVGSNKITTGQLNVTLYQKEPVSEKVQARTLRIGLYTRDGKLISDSHQITFDLTSEHERERERSVRLILSQDSQDYNNQAVYVRLLWREADTSYDFEYKSAEYLLRSSFTRDFDF